jgi:hypothetical protein
VTYCSQKLLLDLASSFRSSHPIFDLKSQVDVCGLGHSIQNQFEEVADLFLPFFPKEVPQKLVMEKQAQWYTHMAITDIPTVRKYRDPHASMDNDSIAYYSRNTGTSISLDGLDNTKHARKVLVHEYAHCVHDRLQNRLIGKDKPLIEFFPLLTEAVLGFSRINYSSRNYKRATEFLDRIKESGEITPDNFKTYWDTCNNFQNLRAARKHVITQLTIKGGVASKLSPISWDTLLQIENVQAQGLILAVLKMKAASHLHKL